MSDEDYSVESEDEFLEDFSGWEITDEELAEILIRARKSGDSQLRRLVKQNQYFRWLLRNFVEFSERSGDTIKLIDLTRLALKTTEKKES